MAEKKDDKKIGDNVKVRMSTNNNVSSEYFCFRQLSSDSGKIIFLRYSRRQYFDDIYHDNDLSNIS